MRIINAALIAALLVALLAGCALSGGEDSGSGKGLVAFSQGDLSNEWRVSNNEDMEKSFKDAGYDFTWTDAKADPAKQLSDVEDLLAKQPELLVIAPVEYEPLAPVKDMAERADVPLIVIDREIPGEPGEGNWISMLTVDFVESGRWVAQDAVEDLTKKNGEPEGKIVHITGNIGASPVIDEQKGIDEVLKKNPGVEIVASCDGRYAREPGRRCMEDFLQRFPEGEIDGVIADNDEEALGAIQAIEAAGRDELLNFVWGKDASKTGLQALLDEKMSFTVQTPPRFGEMTIDTFEKWKADGKVDPMRYIAKEKFDNDTPQQMERVRERIKELDKIGTGCC